MFYKVAIFRRKRESYMWILTQNGKRILSTEGLDEITVADPAEGKTDFAIMLRRRTDGKPFALGFY